MHDNLFIFDLEGDSLTPTKIHCISTKNSKGKMFSTVKYDEMRTFFSKEDAIFVGHNIYRFDIPVVERLLDVEVKAKIVDTLALSWYLYPQRNKHGLEEWGVDLGYAKKFILDWDDLPIKEYIDRCEGDVKINSLLWDKMWEYLITIYDTEEDVWRLIDYLMFKMKCARLQEKNGWDVDVPYAQNSIDEMEKIKEAKVEELFKAMPKVPIKKKKSKPKRSFNKEGNLTKLGLAWVDLLNEHDLPLDHEGDIEIVDGYAEPNPNSNDQLKDWLFSLGWKPETEKYVKDKTTGETRSIPQINLPEGKGVCPSIKKLFEKEPALEALDGLSILNHRIPLLKNIVHSVDDRCRTKAQIAGFTNTLRSKHATVVNLPRVNRPHAEAVRGCLVASKGTLLCGSDMSGLEDRLKRHFIFPLDPEYVLSMSSEDFDPHLTIAVMAGLLTQEQADAYKSGDEDAKKKFKPVRDIAKNCGYACQYGAGIPRLMITGGISKEQATNLYNAYWALNWAVKEVAKQQRHKTVNDQMWLFNPVSKLWYSLRYEKDIFSTLVQGTAAFVFLYWLGIVLKSADELIGEFHDEWIIRIPEYKKEWMDNVVNKAIDTTNKHIQLNVPLAAGIQYGERYSEIH